MHSMMGAVRPIRVRVHQPSGGRLDGVLRLVEEAARPRPLPEVLRAMGATVAEIARVDVVSVYVLEDDGATLVLRANVGFPAGAVGNVRVRVGGGVTGFVAGWLRPGWGGGGRGG